MCKSLQVCRKRPALRQVLYPLSEGSKSPTWGMALQGNGEFFPLVSPSDASIIQSSPSPPLTGGLVVVDQDWWVDQDWEGVGPALAI